MPCRWTSPRSPGTVEDQCMAIPVSATRTHHAPHAPRPAPALADLIAPQLKAVDELFSRELTSDLPNVNELVTHVGKFRGKMLRPMLVLLSGLAASEKHENALTTDH